MKKFLLPTTFIALLAALVFALPSCSETHAGSTETNVEDAPVEVNIPQLMGRTEGLGTPEERAHVASVYDEKVALVRNNNENGDAWLSLVELFINEARITGEHPYYYPAALELLKAMPEAALAKDDQKFKAAYLEASVQLSLHDFANAYETGKKAQAIFPLNAGIYGVLIDAKVEMGHYAEAVELSDKMVSIRPDLRSYARISYLREIHGEYKGAIEAMDMAVTAGMPGYEQTAWCRLTLGNLHEEYGNLEEAKMQYQRLLGERPEYPFAYAGLASVEMKNGNLDKSMELLDKAISLIPEVGFYMQKADLHAAMGEQDKADALYPEILAMMKEDSDAGHNMDLEVGLVHLDLGNKPDKALEYIKKAAKGREANIEVNAAYAATYLEMGDLAKAEAHINKAMATNTMNPEYLGLAGMILLKNGNAKKGKDLIRKSFELNPFQRFGWTEEARAALS